MGVYKKIMCLILLAGIQSVNAQSYLDKYLSSTLTYTVIGDSANGVDKPRDLDFKPYTNELWVCNYATMGSIVIFYDAGKATQTSEFRTDTHSDHFMSYPSSIAFSDIGEWASVGELRTNTSSSISTFMGPSLWSGDTAVFARVFQNNWVAGLPLGSHLDMLHQSPYSMGIAFDSAKAYWVYDGWNGNLCKYNYVSDHGPGYDDHSAGVILRYTDVPVTRVPGVPSHMVLDHTSGWLYFVESGSKTIKRLNTRSGTKGDTIVPPNTSFEPLAGYFKVTGAVVEIIDTLQTQPCGIDWADNRLVVSDYDGGNFYMYNTSSAPVLIGSFTTGMSGNMGIKIGPDSKLWFVNYTQNKVYRIDISDMPATDVAIESIEAPFTSPTNARYYSPAFNICDGNIVPQVSIKNNGVQTVNEVGFRLRTDNGTFTTYNWTGTLATGATTTVTLPALTTTTGRHLLSVEIISVNQAADEITQNNRVEGAFRTVNPAQTLPYTQGFASTITFPPVGWNYINHNKTCFMSRGGPGGFGQTTGSLKMNNYSGDMDITGQHDYMMFPLLDFSATNATAGLKFNVAYARRFANSDDALQVWASSDCGNSWNTVYSKSGDSLMSSATLYSNAFTPQPSQWRRESVNLSAYAGQTELMLMFVTVSNFGNNLYIDDVYVGDVVTGIDNFEIKQNVTVYPNPIKEEKIVVITSNSTCEETDYILTDILGRKLLSGKLKAGYNEIELPELEKGIYMLEMNSANIPHFTKLIKP